MIGLGSHNLRMMDSFSRASVSPKCNKRIQSADNILVTHGNGCIRRNSPGVCRQPLHFQGCHPQGPACPKLRLQVRCLPPHPTPSSQLYEAHKLSSRFLSPRLSILTTACRVRSAAWRAKPEAPVPSAAGLRQKQPGKSNQVSGGGRADGESGGPKMAQIRNG